MDHITLTLPFVLFVIFTAKGSEVDIYCVYPKSNMVLLTATTLLP
jgi:hypothetical protein